MNKKETLEQLENYIEQLVEEYKNMRYELETTKKERDMYKSMYENLYRVVYKEDVKRR